MLYFNTADKLDFFYVFLFSHASIKKTCVFLIYSESLGFLYMLEAHFQTLGDGSFLLATVSCRAGQGTWNVASKYPRSGWPFVHNVILSVRIRIQE